jgi:Na+/melibiose symporter-like transporter
MSNDVQLKPRLFGWFERFTASLCMAIPLLIIIADMPRGPKRFMWLVLVLALVIIVFPPAMKWLLKKVTDKKHGVATTVTSIILLVLFWIACSWTKLEPRETISAYIRMEEENLFGMLLGIAAMLLIVNGVVYREEKRLVGPRWWWWNIVLGISLLGVIIFRCDVPETYSKHMWSAGIFFVGCAVSAGLRVKGTDNREKKEPQKAVKTEKEEKRKTILHATVDLIPVLIMALAFIYWWACDSRGVQPVVPVTLFGVECIALWILGVDFILVSMKKERA